MSRHFDDLDAVLEFDALDDFRQLIFALHSSPCFRGGVDELEHHKLGRLGRQGSLRPHGSMTPRREHALDRVGNRYEDHGACSSGLDRFGLGVWCTIRDEGHREHVSGQADAYIEPCSCL